MHRNIGLIFTSFLPTKIDHVEHFNRYDTKCNCPELSASLHFNFFIQTKIGHVPMRLKEFHLQFI